MQALSSLPGLNRLWQSAAVKHALAEPRGSCDIAASIRPNTPAKMRIQATEILAS